LSKHLTLSSFQPGPSITRRDFLQLAAAAPYVPGAEGWDSGFAGDQTALDAAVEWAMPRGTTSVIVLHRGRIAAERHAGSADPAQPEAVYSITKSVTATLIGAALDDGSISSLEIPMKEYFPSWGNDRRRDVQLRHVLSMTSGILAARGFTIPKGVDQADYTAVLPSVYPAGERWVYDNNVYRLLFRVLEESTGDPLPRYAQRKLFGPLQMSDTSWQRRQGASRPNYQNIRTTARDLARFGLLALRRGLWEDRQIVSQEFWGRALSTSQDLNPSYGLLWWANGGSSFTLPGGAHVEGPLWPEVPADAFGALGASGRRVWVVPSRELVVARLARRPTDRQFAGAWSFDNQLLRRVCAACG